MPQTAKMARSKTLFYRSGTGQYNYEYAEITLFTWFFWLCYYTKHCIKNIVLIDPIMGTGKVLLHILLYIEVACGELDENSVVRKFRTTATDEKAIIQCTI